jgi:hypothetical protein
MLVAIGAEKARLPPAFIHTAQFDPFGDGGEEYAQRLGGLACPCMAAVTRHDPLFLHAAHDPLCGSSDALSAKSAISVKLPPLPERRLPDDQAGIGRYKPERRS